MIKQCTILCGLAGSLYLSWYFIVIYGSYYFHLYQLPPEIEGFGHGIHTIHDLGFVHTMVITFFTLSALYYLLEKTSSKLAYIGISILGLSPLAVMWTCMIKPSLFFGHNMHIVFVSSLVLTASLCLYGLFLKDMENTSSEYSEPLRSYDCYTDRVTAKTRRDNNNCPPYRTALSFESL